MKLRKSTRSAEQEQEEGRKADSTRQLSRHWTILSLGNVHPTWRHIMKMPSFYYIRLDNKTEIYVLVSCAFLRAVVVITSRAGIAARTPLLTTPRTYRDGRIMTSLF